MTDTVTSSPIRRLNEEGISVLRNCLAGIRNGESAHEPLKALVKDPQYTNEIEDGGTLDSNHLFPDQMSMIQYILAELGTEFIANHRKDKGFWTWVALLYNQQILKETKTLGADARWIYESDDYRASRRHYVAGPIYLYLDFEKCCDNAKDLLFSAKLTAFSGMRDAITYTPEVGRIPAFMQVVAWLYHNPSSPRKIKPGSSSQDKPGTIRDLIHVIGQFAKTQDFYEVDDAKELWDLLPDQFDKFKDNAVH